MEGHRQALSAKGHSQEGSSQHRTGLQPRQWQQITTSTPCTAQLSMVLTIAVLFEALQTYLEALEDPATLCSLLLLSHGRPDIGVHHIRALHCLHGMCRLVATSQARTPKSEYCTHVQA